MNEEPEKSSVKVERDELGRIKPGQQSLNPAGRPKGSLSVIGRIRQIFEENPEEFDAFIESYRKEPNNSKHLVEMLDGKPHQNIGVEGTMGVAIQFADTFNKDVNTTSETSRDN